MDCDWFILSLLLPTPTIWFSLDHQRKKCKRSDSSDADSIALMTPIFYLHWVISALTTPTRSLVKTSLYGMTNNGFEMLEKARFFFWCTCQFVCYFDRWITFTVLWNISREKFFQVLWIFSRYFICFMWNMEISRTSGRRAEAIVCSKMSPSGTEQLEDEDYVSSI